ncbi:MAG: tyrosine-type recombinase/integrase [Candidatus Dormibacteraceae bacterium]
MRQGTTYRRCGSCGRTVHQAKARECPNCGGTRISWAYKVDIAPPGADRQLRSGSGFSSRREVLEAVARLQTDKLDGRYVDPSKITLGDYLDKWWAEGTWSGNTRREYRSSVQYHIKPHIGKLRLQEVTVADIEKLFTILLREGKRSRGKDSAPIGEPLSMKTVQNVKICLRKAFNDARGKYLSPNRENPAVITSFKYSRAQHRPEMQTWTIEEQKKFLDFTTQDRNYLLYVLALTTGMRRGELLGLRRRDIDLDGTRVHVRRQWTRDGTNGLVIKGLKNGSRQWRTLELDEVTVDLLKTHLEARKAEQAKWGLGSAEDWVFCHPDGSRYDPDTITKQFQRRAGPASVPVIRFHDCRHTHATLLLEDGHSLNYVASRLGDQEKTVLENYGHVTAKKRAGAAVRIGELLWG